MNYEGDFGRVEYDEEAEIFHGEFSGIRDVVSFQQNIAG